MLDIFHHQLFGQYLLKRNSIFYIILVLAKRMTFEMKVLHLYFDVYIGKIYMAKH
jgi:hypothetical protein